MNRNNSSSAPLPNFSRFCPIFSNRVDIALNEPFSRTCNPIICSYIHFSYRVFPYCEFDIRINEFLLRAVQNGAFDQEVANRLFPFGLQALAIPRNLVSFLLRTSILEQNATIASLTEDLLGDIEEEEERQLIYDSIAPRLSRMVRNFVNSGRSFWGAVPDLLTEALQSGERFGFGAITVIGFYESNDLFHTPSPPVGTEDIPRLIQSWNFLRQFRNNPFFKFRAMFIDLAKVGAVEPLVAKVETILTGRNSVSLHSVLPDGVRMRQVPLVMQGWWLHAKDLLDRLHMTEEPTKRAVRVFPPLGWAHLGQIQYGDDREPIMTRGDDGQMVQLHKYSRFW